MKRVIWTCALGFTATVLLLATGLPLRDVSGLGQASTVMLYVFNPPALVVAALTYEDEHESENASLKSTWQYPLMAASSASWWSIVGLGWSALMRRRRASASAHSMHSEGS